MKISFFFKEPVGLFATFSCQVLICSIGEWVAGGLSAAPLYSHRYLRVLQRCQTSLQAGTADETGQDRGRPPHAELITEKILLLRGRVFGVRR